MKTALALCVLCALPLFSQNSPVETGSRVPSVNIILAAQNGTSYAFTIYNGSGQAITALSVLLVPRGVSKEKDSYACKNRCSDSTFVRDIDHPVIPAGSAQLVKYEIAKVRGGAVIVEAAIFENETYAGNEQAAAQLLARQLGNQAEYDRITSAVGGIMNMGYFSGKGTQIESTLSTLPVSADSPETGAFNRWFPNILDCNRRFPKIMEEAAIQERSDAAQTLQPLFAKGNPSEVSLTSWWRVTEKQIAKYGCEHCADKLAHPSPVASRRTISYGCSPEQARARHAREGDNALSDAGNDNGDQNDANDASQDNGSDDDTTTAAPASAAPAADAPTTTRKAAKEVDPFAPVPAGPMVKVYPPDRSAASGSTPSTSGSAPDAADNSEASATSPTEPTNEAAADSTEPPPAPPQKSGSFLAGRSPTELLIVISIAAVVFYIAARALKTL